MTTHAVWRRPVLVFFAAALAAGSATSAATQRVAEPAGCPLGAEETCYRQALDLMETVLASRDARRPGLGEALGRFRELCERGLGDACFFAGRIVGAMSNQSTRALVPAGEQAVALFRTGCHARRPSAAACNALGFAYVYLPDVAPPDSALGHLEEGCGLGSPTACARVAARLDDWPAGRATTRPAALERAACQGGSPAACIRVGQRARTIQAAGGRGRGAVPAAEVARADSVVRAGCDRLPTACTAAGAAFARSDSAARYFELACTGPEAQARDSSWVGDGRGCARRGYLQLRRARTARDTADALPWFNLGCALLDSDACADLAWYAYRAGVEDALSAVRAVTACLEDSGYGCWVAGELYADPARAEPGRVEGYRTRACRLGYGPGCTALAGMLDEARAGDAFKHLRRACALRDGAGCRMYGEELVGIGILERADVFVARACELGDARACWQAVSRAQASQDPVREGEYRSRACRLDRAYCKQKAPVATASGG